MSHAKKHEKKEESPLIIQYTDLLHKYRNPQRKEVKAFVEQHKDDEVFMQRVETLNKLWQLKQLG